MEEPVRGVVWRGYYGIQNQAFGFVRQTSRNVVGSQVYRGKIWGSQAYTQCLKPWTECDPLVRVFRFKEKSPKVELG